MYRIAYQYVFTNAPAWPEHHDVPFEHAAADPGPAVPHVLLCLNAAYTHEFFCAPVKRRLEPASMLRLNWPLMVGSSLATWKCCATTSTGASRYACLQFCNRKHDVANTLCIAVAFSVWGH